MVPSIEIPGHVVLRPLRQGEGLERTVLLTERAGTRCVTRIWNTPVPRERLEILRGLATGREIPADAFPSDLAADFEGYRVRASLGAFPSLPEVIDVGLLSPDEASSRPFITTRWIEGNTLRDALQRYAIDFEDRAEILRQLLGILAELHRHNVLHGDLKPENVIVGGDGTHLIDLDTLRRVEGPTDFAIVSQVTWSRVWPECQRDRPDGRRDYIASLPSDLWTYGLMVSELLGDKLPGDRGFPPELPPPWNAVLKACLRARPATRPSTDELLKAVHAEPADLGSWAGDPCQDDATVRVPDRNPAEPRRSVSASSVTDRVADPAPPPAAPAATAVAADGAAAIPEDPRRARPGGGGLRRALLILGPIALLLLVASWLQDGGEPRAQDLAALREQVRAHKSEPALNTLAQARSLAEQAGALAFDPDAGAEAWGLYALLSVWGRGWHFASQGRLDDREFALHYARTGFALERGETDEALLARAIAAGAACRLKRGEPDRADFCDESRRRTRQLLRRRRLEGWFLVEVLWNAGMLERTEALAAWDAGDATGYRRMARADLELCDAGESVVDQAPINGPEFAEHCIAAALAVGEPDKWLWWTEELEGTRARDRAKIAQHIYRNAHPDCRDERLVLNAYRREDEEPGVREYCAFQALTAMQCPEQALRVVCGYGVRSCELPDSGAIPWQLAGRARRRAARGACYLDERDDDRSRGM